jgi:hypothetical protein
MLYTWKYIDFESVEIYTTKEDNENAYDTIGQIVEQLIKENIKNFRVCQ